MDKLKELEELEQQFSEFQETSKEVEKELETEVQRAEKKSKDMTAQYQRLKIDFEEALVIRICMFLCQTEIRTKVYQNPLQQFLFVHLYYIGQIPQKQRRKLTYYTQPGNSN